MQAEDTQTVTSTQAARQDDIEINVDVGAWLTNEAVLLFFIVVLTWLSRYLVVRELDFPIQSGGLLYVMVESLVENSYQLPMSVPYNGEQFPFVLPPLIPYLLAFLTNWSDAPPLQMFLAYPAAASTMTVIIMYLLCRRLLDSKLLSFTAALTFSILPGITEWLLVGSGAARATGMVFGLLALHQAYLLIHYRNENHLIPTTLLIALAFWSEPEVGYFTSYSTLLMLLMFGRNRYSLLHMLLVTLGVVMLVGMWLFPAVMVHGVRPYFSAMLNVWETNAHLLHGTLSHNFTGEILAPVLALLGVLGMLVLIAKRRFFIPLWLLIIWLLQPRSAVALGTVPMAMMVAIAIHQLLLPMLTEGSRAAYGEGIVALRFSANERLRTLNRYLYRVPPLAAGLLLLLFVIYGSYLSLMLLRSDVVPIEEVNAMTWIAESGEIPEGAIFLVITADNHWSSNAVSNWFPVLAKRRNLLTVRHVAWVGDLKQSQRFYEQLRGCLNADVICLEQVEIDMIDHGWQIIPAETDSPANELPRQVFNYVYISRQADGALVTHIDNDDGFVPVRSEGDVLIFRRDS